MKPVRLQSPDTVTAPETLTRLFGPFHRIERRPLVSVGFSAARHEQLAVHTDSGNTVHLVSKRVRLQDDWTARRTGDRIGREAAILGEPGLAEIWNVYACPYRAYGAKEGDVCLLLDDLSTAMLPAPDSRLFPEQEELFITALAALHARYWNAAALHLPLLAAPVNRFRILDPHAAAEELPDHPRHPLFTSVQRGWETALTFLPTSLREELWAPAQWIVKQCADLPQTLLHGDAKIDNFAFLPEGRIAAFDWAVAGTGVPTLDLAYFLAVNWNRLASTKNSVIDRYRNALEQALGVPIATKIWQRLLALGLIGGARMLLWSKALALAAQAPGADIEWQWWMDHLQWALRPR